MNSDDFEDGDFFLLEAFFPPGFIWKKGLGINTYHGKFRFTLKNSHLSRRW